MTESEAVSVYNRETIFVRGDENGLEFRSFG